MKTCQESHDWRLTYTNIKNDEIEMDWVCRFCDEEKMTRIPIEKIFEHTVWRNSDED